MLYNVSLPILEVATAVVVLRKIGRTTPYINIVLVFFLYLVLPEYLVLAESELPFK